MVVIRGTLDKVGHLVGTNRLATLRNYTKDILYEMYWASWVQHCVHRSEGKRLMSQTQALSLEVKCITKHL